MRNYEIKVSAAYMVNGVKKYNCFTEYRTAENTAEAKKKLKAELKAEGYKNIELTAIAV